MYSNVFSCYHRLGIDMSEAVVILVQIAFDVNTNA